MGKKYVIEIEDEPFVRNDDPVIPHGVDELWRVKGFKSLVFDQYGLDQLEELNADYVNEHFGDLQDTAYGSGVSDGLDIGRNEAWEAAKKISQYSWDEDKINAVFPEYAAQTKALIFGHYTATEAIEKIKVYEQTEADTHEIQQNIRGFMKLYGYTPDKIIKAAMIERDGGCNVDCSTCKYENDPDGAKCRNCYDYYQWEPKKGNEHEAD